RDASDPKLALGMDILAPEGYGEVVGGGQREDDLATLEQRLEEHQLPREAFTWYLDLRKYGSVPHSGFGLGVERTVAWLCGLHHVLETIPFGRMMERIPPSCSSGPRWLMRRRPESVSRSAASIATGSPFALSQRARKALLSNDAFAGATTAPVT